MNYLAHLHIAEYTQSSFLGNFLGDFVKGSLEGEFNSEIVAGIRLHRFVDSYTDHHVLTKKLKPFFKKDLRRFSPVALDMFWDHCLAKHWLDFNKESLATFSINAQVAIEYEKRKLKQELPERFEKVSQLFWRGKWFEHYQDINNIDFALQRIAASRPRMAPLSGTFATLDKHYDFLTETFFELYPDILKSALIQIKKET